jgi:hypothetical protein
MNSRRGRERHKAKERERITERATKNTHKKHEPDIRITQKKHKHNTRIP